MSVTAFHPPRASGTRWFVILGPPGTGKTQYLLDRFKEELDSGTSPEKISYVTYTRAARIEALDRVGQLFSLGTSDLRWCRTIHSTAYMLLGLNKRQIMSRDKLKEFANIYHYKLTDLQSMGWDMSSATLELPKRTADDLLRYVYEWGKNRQLNIERSMGLCPINVPASLFRVFAQRLDDFKRQHELYDFTDILNRVLDEDLRPNVDVAFIDEAQDLSPLQIAVVESWFADCQRVYVAGDDDQSIYSFQGAEPGWLLDLTKRYPTTILTESYRIPQNVFTVSQKIIARNRFRVPKSFRPTQVPGEVLYLSMEKAMELVDEKADILFIARNRMFLKPVADYLFTHRAIYLVEGSGGISPLSNPLVVSAVRCAHRLACGKDVSVNALAALLSQIPSRGAGILPHGIKSQVQNLEGSISIAEIQDGLGLTKMLEAIRLCGPASVLLKLPPLYREYFQAVLNRCNGLPDPSVKLTSVHSAKGREANQVFVLPDMTRSTYAEYLDGVHGGNESENRVCYVATTRSKWRLVIIQPNTRRFYHYPNLNKTQFILGTKGVTT